MTHIVSLVSAREELDVLIPKASDTFAALPLVIAGDIRRPPLSALGHWSDDCSSSNQSAPSETWVAGAGGGKLGLSRLVVPSRGSAGFCHGQGAFPAFYVDRLGARLLLVPFAM